VLDPPARRHIDVDEPEQVIDDLAAAALLDAALVTTDARLATACTTRRLCATPERRNVVYREATTR
jgi:hypothetical protein